MPVVNPLARELVFKVVYYGPGLGGKTTTLQHIHATTKPEHRGKMVSLATPVDRTLYFDFLPIRLPNVRGMTVRLQLFTVPGQVYYNATRKLVLTGADGVVLVVDSQRARADSNLESLENLRDNLREHGRLLQDVPHALAYNKRDLADVLPIEEMDGALNRHHAPSFATVATSGDGVYETLEAITRLVLEDFERRLPAGPELQPGSLQLPEGGLAEALRGAGPGRAAPDVAVADFPRAEPRTTPSGLFRFSGFPDPEDAPGEDAARLITDQGQPQPSEAAPERETWRSRPGGELAAAASAGPASSAPPGSAPSSARPSEARLSALAAPLSMRPAVAEEGVNGSTRAPGEGDREPAADDGPQQPASSASSAPVSRRSTEVSPTGPPLPDVGRGASSAGVSFEALWPDSERDTVRDLELAIVASDGRAAVLACDQLLSRTLASAASLLGSASEAPRDPAVVALLLGLDGGRYLQFRTLVRDVRSGVEPTVERVLGAYAFVIDARLLRSQA
ncbi:MAG TPA: gliding motility protein [Polyangiaceae bacterium]|nr:gliding motility protein [Polyangiaceae bacterium]